MKGNKNKRSQLLLQIKESIKKMKEKKLQDLLEETQRAMDDYSKKMQRITAKKDKLTSEDRINRMAGQILNKIESGQRVNASGGFFKDGKFHFYDK